MDFSDRNINNLRLSFNLVFKFPFPNGRETNPSAYIAQRIPLPWGPGASRDTHQTCPPISRIFRLLIGFGENCRVLEWVLKRCNDEDVADPTPIGYVPKLGTINTDGLDKPVDMEKLFAIPKDYWLEECESLRKYYEEQVGEDLPKEITDELNALVARLNAA